MTRIFKWSALPVLILMAIGLTAAVYGEFYRYVDKQGKTHFVDDMVKVPLEYRDQLKTYDEPLDYLSDEEKKALREKEALQDSMKTNVVISGNSVIIPVKIINRGKEIDVFLMLDTGASITTLHRNVAEELDIQVTRKGRARVAGGDEITFDITNLDSVKVGPLEKNDLMVGIVDYQGGASPHSGLLGMNFLQHFEYIIDYENRVIRWNPERSGP